MCLKSVGRVNPVALGYQCKKKTKFGYRAIHRSDRNLDLESGKSYVNLKMGVKYEAVNKNYTIRASNGKCYKAGFHIFHHIRDARTYIRWASWRDNLVIVRVRVSGPKRGGTQAVGGRRAKCTVAPRITLLHEVSRDGKRPKAKS